MCGLREGIWIVTKLGAKDIFFFVFKTSPFGASIKLPVQSAKLRFEITGFYFYAIFHLKKEASPKGGKKTQQLCIRKAVIGRRQCCVALKLSSAHCDSYTNLQAAHEV